MACEIVDALDLREHVRVEVVTSDHWQTDYFAPRPQSEQLVNLKLKLKGMNLMRTWQDNLRIYLESHDWQLPSSFAIADVRLGIPLANKCAVSVVVVSLSGRDDVFRACASALAQSVEDKEVLVFLDRNDRRRANIFSQSFPEVRILAVDPECSYITYRNSGFREANGDFVVWLDDDAYFSGRETLREIIRLFSMNSETAAIAVKFVEPHLGRRIQPGGRPLESGMPVKSFIGCSVAFRKDAVVRMGGLRELYHAYGEERDLALRIHQTGLSIRYLSTEPIVHMRSPQRNTSVLTALPCEKHDSLRFPERSISGPDSAGYLGRVETRRVQGHASDCTRASPICSIGLCSRSAFMEAPSAGQLRDVLEPGDRCRRRPSNSWPMTRYQLP